MYRTRRQGGTSRASRTATLGLVLSLTMAAVSILIASPASASVLGAGYDLMPGPLLYAQTDSRWADTLLGPSPLSYTDAAGNSHDRTFGACGCLITGIANILAYEFGSNVNGLGAWDPLPAINVHPEWGWYNPVAVDTYLRLRDATGARGYDSTGLSGCGTIVWPDALGWITQPRVSDVGPLPQGIQLKNWDTYGKGLNDGAKAAIRFSLYEGNPVIVKVGDSKAATHVYLITGVDEDGNFLAHDVANGGPSLVQLYGGNYEQWVQHVQDYTTYHLVTPGAFAWFGMLDDPGPVDIAAVGPDGARSGLDPTTGEPYEQDPRAVYNTDVPETDLAGTAVPAKRGVELYYREPLPGHYRYTLRNDGDAPERFTAAGGVMNSSGGHPLPSQTIDVGPHSTVKVDGIDNGQSVTIATTNDFSPQPLITTPTNPTDHVPLVIDGSRSFDADGAITDYTWDFGDGSSGTGAQPTHTYAHPGTYAVTLTVRDSADNSSSATKNVQVAPYETTPPTTSVTARVAATGASLDAGGWASDQVDVAITATDPGSAAAPAAGVDQVRWWSTGAQPHDPVDVAGNTASTSITAAGLTTIHVQAVDAEGNAQDPTTFDVGIDRHAPASTITVPVPGSTVSALPFISGATTDADPPLDQVSGSASTAVSLQRARDGLYWDGTAWGRTDSWLTASGHGDWWIGSQLPRGGDLPDGDYRLSSRGTDAADNVETAGAPINFTVRHTDTPAVTIRPLASGGGTFPSDNEWPHAALDAHTVVGAGWDTAAGGAEYLRSGLVWSGDQVTAMPPLTSVSGASANAISPSGEVVGSSWTLGQPHAVRWDMGAATTLPALPVPNPAAQLSFSDAYDVNTTGDIVGWSYDDTTHQVATVWRHGSASAAPVATPFGAGNSMARAINDAGVIVGDTVGSGTTGRAFRTAPGQPSVELAGLGGDRSYALAINAGGDVVGASDVVPGGVDHAVLWSGGQTVDLGPGVATSIADDGTIAGLRNTGNGFTAALWRDGQEQDLVDLLPSGTPWDLNVGNAVGGVVVNGSYHNFDLPFPAPVVITADGALVGSGRLNGAFHGFVLTGAAASGGSTGGAGDTTPPVTAAAVDPAPNDAGWNAGPVTVHLHATDAGGADPASGVAAITTTDPDHASTPGDAVGVGVTAAGRTELRYAASDNAGNTEDPAGEITVRIDPTAPDVAVSGAPAAGTWSNAPVTLTVAAHDTGGSGLTSISSSINGHAVDAAAAGDDASTSVPVTAEGTTPVTSWATDAAGNVSARITTQVRIDRTPPAISVETTAPPGGSVGVGTIPLIKATDDLSGLASISATITEPSGDTVPYALGSALHQLGTAVLHIDATDNAGNTVHDDVAMDVTGPTVTPVVPVPGDTAPAADAGGPVYAAVTGVLMTLDGSHSSDADGDPLTYTWTLDDGTILHGPRPQHSWADLGRHVVTLVVNDGREDSSTAYGPHGSFAYVDVGPPTNRPPDCAAATATPSILWPPDHTLRPVPVTVPDPEGDPVRLTVRSVTQDEPVQSVGDGSTAPDAAVDGAGRVSVRSERDGSGDGRVYAIRFAAVDPGGATCTGVVTVAVAHDRSSVAIDSGQRFDSFTVSRPRNRPS